MERRKLNIVALVCLIVGTVAFARAMSATRPINCKYVSCAAPQCEDYEHLQVPPGQCCPVCVHN